MSITALAHPNIALAKYWGKRPYGKNLPAVPSLSLTLSGMATETRVTPQDAPDDSLLLDGRAQSGRPLVRVTELLDLMWREAERAGPRPRVRVTSRNDFPTAAGLASSASAFAALAVAGDAALGTGLGRDALSCIARRVSASAGRSLFGGFVELPAGREGDERLPAQPLAPPDHWDVALIVAVTAEGQKKIGSTEGMLHTAATSPLYAGWIEGAPAIFERARAAVLARDLPALGAAMEHSSLSMHATAMAADPGLLYWNGTSVEVMHAVRGLRDGGLGAWFTMDAGPHVKVLCEAGQAARVSSALADIALVRSTIVTRPGEGARLVEAS